jgi:hypothetical protein
MIWDMETWGVSEASDSKHQTLTHLPLKVSVLPIFIPTARFAVPHGQPVTPVHNQNTFTNANFSWDHKQPCFVCKNGKLLKRKARAQWIRNT